MRDDAAYCTFEHEARRQKRGLWALPPEQRVAPWEWRKRGNRSTFTDYSRETAENCIAAIDVSKRESVHALVKAATAIGDVTGVIHAAGVSPSQASPATILAVDYLRDDAPL